jgi:signal transduction histidine kinase
LRVGQRTEELKEALEAKSMFLTSAGHELRTPLNGLIGMTTLAIDECASADLREYLSHAKSSAQQLTQKVNQLLDLASLETGTLRIELEEMLVGEELDRAVAKHRVGAEEKGLAFSVSLDPALNQKFIVAKRRLIQIVDNLLSNAIKFTEEGEVMLTASLRDRGNGVTWLDLLVEDSGCGMSESDETVFDLKTNNNLPSSKTGLGIALSISRRVTQLMGGVMEVIESNGQGTKMKVTVPLPRVSGESLV